MLETQFYKDLIKFKCANNEMFSFIYDDSGKLNEDDWNNFIKITCQHTLRKIETILGRELNILPTFDNKNWHYEAWLFNLCVQIQYDLCLMLNNNIRDNFNDVYVVIENFRFNKWSKQLKKRSN